MLPPPPPKKKLGKTTLLVPQIYLVCTIGPLSFKLLQLVS